MGFSSIIESIKLKKQEKYIGMSIPWYFIYDASSFSLYDIVSDIAIFVLKRDVKLQLTNSLYDIQFLEMCSGC